RGDRAWRCRHAYPRGSGARESVADRPGGCCGRPDMSTATASWERALSASRPEHSGTVQAVVGLGVQVLGIDAAVGDRVRIDASEHRTVDAEVVAVDGA